MEQDIPDYNMDAEDEVWVRKQAKTFDITSLKFEVMMDRLEKGSGQQVCINVSCPKFCKFCPVVFVTYIVTCFQFSTSYYS